MSDFLPYAIIAGIVIVFFVVCYVLFAGNSGERKEERQEHRAPAVNQKPLGQRQQAVRRRPVVKAQPKRPVKKEDTSPLPKISTVTVRERQEHPNETAFVTTKGEAVRKNGRIVYEAAKSQDKKPTPDDLEITRVLSRDEVLAAMEKVDREEAAAYKAKEEEAKKSKQRQAAAEKEAEEKRIAADTAKRHERHVEEAAAQKQTNWATDIAGSGKAPLADMAAMVSQDLAEKEGTTATPKTPHHRNHIIQNVIAETARAAGRPVEVEEYNYHDDSIKRSVVMPPNAQPAPQPAKPAAKAQQKASDVTQIIDREGMAKVASELEQTQRMEPIHVDTMKKDNAPEETIIMKPIRTHQVAPQRPQTKTAPVSTGTEEMQPKQPETSPWGSANAAPSISAKKARPSIWDNAVEEESPVVKQCVAHFLNQFGMVTPEMSQQAEYITAAAFEQVGCVTDGERKKVIMPLIAQEALQNVQKAYTSHPEDYVATLALQAFYDIIHCPPVSTRHLVAIDALKVMPYLSGYHYKILALLLLFLYSRNSHNVDKEAFGQYIDKYVVPFLDNFPTERPYFQQLEYLHCTAFESKETRFAEILSDSYPLLFRYRGITEEELRKALKGQRMPKDFVVPSFNSPLMKLAMVDESMAPQFFRRAGIQDRTVQDHIMRLAKKRPASFSGEEALDVMEDISPALADLSDIWDSTMLRVSTLSLLGLYLAQGYVHECIGEEFDLSRWFD